MKKLSPAAADASLLRSLKSIDAAGRADGYTALSLMDAGLVAYKISGQGLELTAAGLAILNGPKKGAALALAA